MQSDKHGNDRFCRFLDWMFLEVQCTSDRFNASNEINPKVQILWDKRQFHSAAGGGQLQQPSICVVDTQLIRRAGTQQRKAVCIFKCLKCASDSTTCMLGCSVTALEVDDARYWKWLYILTLHSELHVYEIRPNLFKCTHMLKVHQGERCHFSTRANEDTEQQAERLNCFKSIVFWDKWKHLALVLSTSITNEYRLNCIFGDKHRCMCWIMKKQFIRFKFH